MTEPKEISDQRWIDIRDMLINIVVKFADVLDATGLVPRVRMKHAMIWLRDAEACARALVLSMALTMVLGPVKQWAKRLTAKRAATTKKPLYRFRYVVESAPQRRATVKVFKTLALREHLARQRAEDIYQRDMFGRRVEKCRFNRPRLPPRPGANDLGWRKAHPPSPRVSRESFRLRYNAIAMAVENPEPFARRMARRLARNRARTVRAALTRAPHDLRLARSPFDGFTGERIEAVYAEVYPYRNDSS